MYLYPEQQNSLILLYNPPYLLDKTNPVDNFPPYNILFNKSQTNIKKVLRRYIVLTFIKKVVLYKYRQATKPNKNRKEYKYMDKTIEYTRLMELIAEYQALLSDNIEAMLQLSDDADESELKRLQFEARSYHHTLTMLQNRQQEWYGIK